MVGELAASNAGQAHSKDERLLKQSLQRLYNEVNLLLSQKADKYFGAAGVLSRRFNELLRQAKTLFPDDPRVLKLQDLPPTQSDTINPLTLPKASEELQDTKLRALELMDILDIEVWEKSATPYQVIQVSQIQSSSQLVNLDFDQLLQVIQQQNVDANLKASAEVAVKEFADELAKPKPDASRLKRALDVVCKVGKELAIPLLFKFLENWDKIFKPT